MKKAIMLIAVFLLSFNSTKLAYTQINFHENFRNGAILTLGDFPMEKFGRVWDSLIYEYDFQAWEYPHASSFYKYNYRLYKVEDLDRLIDELFGKLFLNEIPLDIKAIRNINRYGFSSCNNENESFFNNCYKYDNNFKSIIDDINSLSEDDEYIFLPPNAYLSANLKSDKYMKVTNIQQNIQTLDSYRKMLVAFYFLADHYELNNWANYLDLDVYNFTNMIANSIQILKQWDTDTFKSIEKNPDYKNELHGNCLSFSDSIITGTSEYRLNQLLKYEWHYDWISFMKIFDDRYNTELHFNVNQAQTSFDFVKQKESDKKYIIAKSFELLGDYCNYVGKDQNALEYYYKAINSISKSNYLFEQGILEEKIGDFFSNKRIMNSEFNSRSAFAHYRIAAEKFHLAGDSLHENNIKYKAMLVQINTLTGSNYLLENTTFFPNSSLREFLKTGITGLIADWDDRLSCQNKYYLFLAFGNYFRLKDNNQDHITALYYYQKSTISAMNDLKKYDLDEIYDALDNLIVINDTLGHKDQMKHYHDLKIQLISKVAKCIEENTRYDREISFANDTLYRDWVHTFTHPRDLGPGNQPKGFVNAFHPIGSYSRNYFYETESQYYKKLYKYEGKKELLTLSKYYEDLIDRDLISYSTEEVNKLNHLENFYSTSNLIDDFNRISNELDSLRIQYEQLIKQNSRLLEENKKKVLENLELNSINGSLKFDNFKKRDENEKLKQANDTLERKIFDDSTKLSNIKFELNAIKTQLQTTRNKEQLASEKLNKYLFWSGILFIIIIILSILMAIMIPVLIAAKRLTKKLEINAKKSDIHSAISRVLSRCLSHNIGSHALSKFIDKDKVAILDSEKQYASHFIYDMSEPFRQPELVANFNEYLKHRMDYLADIATTTEPLMESPMYLVRDIIHGIDKNRILLNRISGVSPKISFGIRVFLNGKEINNFKHKDDPLLSITNDVLGAQAFYIIIENVIRNIYKHGNPTGDFDIEIDVRHSAIDNSFYEIAVYDTMWKPKNFIDEIVIKRNETFNESILQPDNTFRDYNLGSIEMAVCASYLRCLPVDSFNLEKFRIDINSPSPDPACSIIYAYNHLAAGLYESNPNSNCSALGYKFFISKPKQVLVISDNVFSLTNEDDKLLKDKGIRVIQPDEINESVNFNHQFIYFNEGLTDTVTEKYPSQLPKRVVHFDPAIATDTAENFIESLWLVYATVQFKQINKVTFKYYEEISEITLSQGISGDMSYKVFIDDHSEKWNCRNCKEITTPCSNNNYREKVKNKCEPLSIYDYYDMACSHSKIKKILSPVIWKNLSQKVQYAENVFNQVIVIDERIQQNVFDGPGKRYDGQMLFYDYFNQQKIFIPRKNEADLNKVSFGLLTQISDLKVESTEADRIRSFIRDRIDQATFCIIHLGIIEKMLPSGSDKTEKRVGEVIAQIFPETEYRRKLIITSNRGGALNIPPDICYVPFTLVQNSLETLFDKFVLTKILYNSRKCK